MLSRANLIAHNQLKTTTMLVWHNNYHRTDAVHGKLQGRKRGHKKITHQFISNAKTLKQMVVDVNMEKFTEKDVYRPYLRKFTMLLQRTEDPETIKGIENLLVQIRRLSSSQLNSSSSDLFNFQLLFKKLRYCFPDYLKFQGFEYRVTMLAQTLPRIFPFSPVSAKSLAILHYMTTYTQLSGVPLKRSLKNYFIRYFLNSNQMKSLQKHNTGMDFKQKIQPQVFAILVSSLNMRDTKITVESMMDQLAISNLNKYWDQVWGQFCVERLLKAQKEKGETQLLKISDLREHFYHLPQNNGKISMPAVINSVQRFLQCVDIFVNLLRYDRTFLIRVENAGYAAIRDLSVYFQIIFNLTPKMNVTLFKDKEMMKFQSTDERLINCDVETMNLWKTAAEIVECLSQNRVHVGRRSNLLIAIFNQTLKLSDIDDSEVYYNKKERIQIFSRYSLQILKILLYSPVFFLSQKGSVNNSANKKICNILLQITKAFSLDEKYKFDLKTDKRKEMTQTMIKIFEFKGDLIGDQKEWVKIFSSLGERDKQYQFWDLYLFLASYRNSKKKNPFEKTIPIRRIMTKINQRKLKLPKITLKGTEQKEYDFQFYQNKSRSETTELLQTQKLNMVKQINDFEIQMLRFHAMTILLDKEHIYFNDEQSIVENSEQGQQEDQPVEENLTIVKGRVKQKQKSKKQLDARLNCSAKQFAQIFDRWMEPFSFHLLNALFGTAYSNKDILQKLRPQMNYQKPLNYFQKYTRAIIFQTCHWNQFKLINKILTHPKFSSFYNNNLTLANLNFGPYAKIVILSLADSSKKEEYLRNFPFEKEMVKDLRENGLFSHFSQMFVPHMRTFQQWEYLLQIFRAKDQIFTAKNFFTNFYFGEVMLKNCLSEESRKNKQLCVKQQEFKKITFYLIQLLIQDCKLERNFKEIIPQKIYATISFIYFSTKWIGPALLVQRYSQEIIGLLMKYKIDCSEKQASLCITKLDIMGFINEEKAILLLKKLQFSYEHDIGKIILMSHLTKTKLSQTQKKDIQGNIFRISSILKHSLAAMIACIRVSQPKNIIKLIKICQDFYNPEEKLILFKQLQKKQEKQKISTFDTKIEDSIKKIEQQLFWHKNFFQLEKIQIRRLEREEEVMQEDLDQQKMEENEHKTQDFTQFKIKKGQNKKKIGFFQRKEE